MLRCKFSVSELSKLQNGRKLRLNATNRSEGDNQDWSKYTPSGQIELTVTNEAAFPQIDAMNIGDLFYIDLKPVPAG